MNRIDQTFQQLAVTGRKALIAFLTAGDPDYDTSLSLLEAVCRAGADIVELGVPFSDPTADGPTIQRASQRALGSGMSLARTIALAADLRQRVATPIVLFSYYNPIYKFGLERFAAAAAAAGVDGTLIVDLPPEESGPLSAALAPHQLHIIRLVAPTTTPQRLQQLCSGAGGFIYLISRTGVTGSGGLDYAAIARHAATVKAAAPHPVCLGFGITNARDARALAPLADGLIVGSALVDIIAGDATASDLPQRVAALLSELRRGCDAAAAT